MDDRIRKTIKILFITRICLCMLALAASITWIVWSFKIYSAGISDVHDYASLLRAPLYSGIVFSALCIALSFILRRISDELKKQ